VNPVSPSDASLYSREQGESVTNPGFPNQTTHSETVERIPFGMEKGVCTVGLYCLADCAQPSVGLI